MPQNRPLHQASRQKKDEFYTQLSDIEKELKHYKQHFRNKVVYCNCDDPWVSKFFHYFSYNFERLGLKQLITTCYKNQQMDIFSTHQSEKAIALKYEGTKNENGVPVIDDVNIQHLEEDGDFRSKECIELLKESDIVVTNPPFSLFREYIAQLIMYDKNFLILGSQNAISYKEVFQYIKEKKVWLGVDNGGTKWFQVNSSYTIRTESRQKWENGKKYFSMGSILWYTNLDHFKRHKELILYNKYSPEEYPKYDNYDAIEVSEFSNIPMDYKGNMGVPITFLNKHNPDQFEIVGMDRPLITELTGRQSRFKIKGKERYARIVIRHRRL